MIGREEIKKGIKNPDKAAEYITWKLGKKWRATKVYTFSRNPIGTHVMSRDWDILIILDTCRVDALKEISSEYSFITDVDTIISRGSHSAEWMAQTFTNDFSEELKNTAYISANPFSKTVIQNKLEVTDDQVEQSIGAVQQLKRWGKWDIIGHEDIGYLDYVWEYALQENKENKFVHDNEIDEHDVPEYITPPEYVTDRGIDTWRSSDFDRMILHYWQPHTPYIANAIKEGRPLYDREESPRDYLRETGNKEAIFDLYLDELRYVLDSVELFLNNADAERVVISADHGEALGEYGQYKHPITCLNPHVKRVPWAVTTATDNEIYTPKLEKDTGKEHSPEEVLKALGYT